MPSQSGGFALSPSIWLRSLPRPPRKGKDKKRGTQVQPVKRAEPVSSKSRRQGRKRQEQQAKARRKREDMGGSAFSSGADPLHTPRMPPDVYHAVKAECHARLRQLFLCVATPIDGAAKADFGDVDILVALDKHICSPLATPVRAARRDQVRPSKMATRCRPSSSLSARSGPSRHPAGRQSANMAIPWPDDLMPPHRTRSCFIQVDVDRVRLGRGAAVEALQACARRPLEHPGQRDPAVGPDGRRGRPVDPHPRDRAPAPHPRQGVPDLGPRRGPALPRPAGRLPPPRRRQLLGRPLRLGRGVYEYVARCRLFVLHDWDDADDADDAPQQRQLSNNSDDDKAIVARQKKRLKANDRRRMNSRPLFRNWIDDFLPRRPRHPPR